MCDSEKNGTIKRPMLAPHLDYRLIEDATVLLVSESFNTLMHGQVYADLLPIIDGRSSETQIRQALGAQYTAEQVDDALASLVARGYVVSGDFKMQNGQAAFWTSLGASPVFVENQLRNQAVAIHNDPDGKLASCLRSLGVDSGGRKDPALSVIVCDDYLDGELVSINRERVARRTPWMLVRPKGACPMYGPVFHSVKNGPCLACLTHRMRNNQEIHTFLRNRLGEDAAFSPLMRVPVLIDCVYGLIASEIAKWLVGRQLSMLRDHVCTFDINRGRSDFHRVQRRVQCRICGAPDLVDPGRKAVPVKLGSCKKNLQNTTGARSVSTMETLNRYRHLISPISGVVSWVESKTPETDPWLHVHWAGANLALRIKSLGSLRRSLRQKSAGKGTSPEQSEAGALCEAIERYSGAFHGEEIWITGRFTDPSLAEDQRAIHPNDVQLFSDLQMENASQINSRGHPYNTVPPRFDIDQPVLWSPVWSLSQRRHRYLPTGLLYSMTPEQRGSLELWSDSNGCASGNTLEEAVLQGFYELVERDAFAIWWYNRLRCPGVDLDSFGDEYLSRAADYYARYNRQIWVLDLTSDLGIPCFVALSRRIDREPEDIIYGAGAHIDPAIAAVRAVCELNQCLTWVPHPGQESDRYIIDDPMCLWWWKNARVADHDYLVQSETRPLRTCRDYNVIEREDMKDDLLWCQSLIEEKGMELLVLDQTRPDIGMPVVRVIVPGLRHFWERFAPGRLYDVPVNLGLLKERTSEENLNPLPVIA